MIKVKFYLKDRKNDVSLVIGVLFLNSSKLLTVTTGIKTKVSDWNCNKQEFKSSSPICNEGNKVLNDLRRKVLELSFSSTMNKDIPELKRFLKKELVGEKNKKNSLGFYDCYEIYMNEKQSKNSEGTLKVYKALMSKVEKFERKQKVIITFDYWEVASMEVFSNYLCSQGYLNDTINNNLKALKAFLNWAYEKYHTNQKYKKYKVVWEKHTVISLSKEEINCIYEFRSTNKSLEMAKDLFLLGVYTTQRFSDIQQLEPSQIEGKYWNITSIKTKKLLKIPLNTKALEILEKYGYETPTIAMQQFNKAIKKVGEAVGIDTPIQKVSYSGIKKVIINEPKWKFITSHTARRSGISLLIASGAPLPAIQKVTGHSNISTLLRYDGTTVDLITDYLEEL